MNEVWADIPGYEGLYQVSTLGTVRSMDRIFHRISASGRPYTQTCKGRVMKPSLNFDGYWNIQLSKNNKSKTLFVHRLVAMAFIPNSENKPQVNHKDKDGKNNVVTNLEWVTQSENMQHAVRTGSLLGGNRGKHLSDETKLKLSKIRSGSTMSEDIRQRISMTVRSKRDQIVDHNPLRRSIYCPELDTSFYSCAEASKYFEVSATAIANCLDDGHKLKRQYTLLQIDRIQKEVTS